MSSIEEEHARRRERAQTVALFRYTLIRDAADASVSPRERGKMVRAIVAAEHRGPFGDPVRASRPSVDLRVPTTYATCWYSWITPPARSRRRTRESSRLITP